MGYFRKLSVFGLCMALGGFVIVGCFCNTDPLATEGDVSQSALSYEGSASGTVKTISSTDAAEIASGSSRKKVLDSSQGQFSGAVAWLTDLEGNRLRDANGNEYPEFVINTDGSFNIGALPVGVDIVLVVDTDGDGEGDLHTIINIPKDGGDALTGSLGDVTPDPLSTLVLSKLRRIAAAHGIDLKDIGISPSALICRIRDAFEHLFGDTGIEEEVVMSQLANLSEEELAALFDLVIPPSVKRAMEMAEGNLELAVATDVDGVVKAVARILLKGGFVIADDPHGVDLSFLGGLPNVKSMTFEEWHNMQMRSSGQGAPLPRPQPQIFEQPTLYLNTVAEPDRNFANMEGEKEGRGGGGPMFSEHVLGRMAQLYLDGKTISLGDLHRIVVDLDVGMGARLTYFKWNGPDQPPTDVFETTDGRGLELNLQELFQWLDQEHLGNADPALFQQKEAELRAKLKEFLAGTAGPSLERLFEGVLTARIGSLDEFAEQLRAKRAHLPFSRSGPATFFVVADADKWQNSAAKAITVDVETDGDGKISKVTYNAASTGKFYVGFGPQTASGMFVDLISRRSGKPLHTKRGEWQQVEMGDGNIFQPVNGQSFLEAFSESGENWPGAPALSVPNHEFDPSLPPDPETNPPQWEIFVLTTEPGPNGVPVKVNYANNVATYDSESGRYYLQFDENTDRDGTFVLISENGDFVTNPQTSRRWEDRVQLAGGDVQGISLAPETFSFIFGTDVPNPGYDATGAPYYDDINGNDVADADEPSFDWREFLWDPNDWRSTWVEKYYRRADNNGFPSPEEIDWDAATPKLRAEFGGTALVPRNLKPRLNAFLFGKPNITINLLSAFSPPDFFDGTHALNRDTRVNPFTAIAWLNLALDSIHNILGKMDWDGPGPMPEHEELIEAHLFMAPIGDPVQLITQGFEKLAR